MNKRICILIILLLLLIVPEFKAESDVGKEIEKEWFLRSKDPETLKRIKDKGFGEGIGNIEEISAALVMDGYRISKSDTARAIEMFNMAVELSPDYPSAHYAAGKAYWHQSFLNIFKTLDEFLSGWKATFRNFWWLFFMMGNLSFALIISILACFFVFAMLMVIRYFPLLNHDIKEKFPAAPILPIKLIPFVLILLFLLFNPGFLYLYLLLMFFVWPYMDIKERGIGIFSLVVMAFLPLIIPYLLLFVTVQDNPELKVMVEVNKGWIDDNGLVDLERRFKDQPRDPEATFSLGLAKKRRGNFGSAFPLYEKILDVRYLSDRVYNNIGNIYTAKRMFEDAVANYKRAIENNPNLVSAHYNLSQVYRETFRFEEGEKEYQEANRIDSELLKTYTSIKGPFFNRFVIDEGLSKKEIWRNILRRSDDNIKLSNAIWMRFMRWIPRKQASFILISLSLTLLAYTLLVGKRSSVYSCIKCGKIVCGRCQIERSVKDICEECYKTLIRMEGSSQNRIERILSVRRYQDKRKGLTNILVFFPGIGHLYSSNPIRGVPFTFLIFLIISWWFLWDYLKTPFKIYPSFFGPAKFSFVLLSLVVYAFLVIDGRRISK